MYILLIILMSYVIGSIPNALIIGKVFFKKDIRQYGSGNLGGSNTGRVLGKKIGMLVIVLDALKVVLAVLLSKLIINNSNSELLNLSVYLSSFSALIGHCYTCFAKFKGGKAVASTFGVLLVINIYLFLITVVLYVFILKLTKLVSLSSIIIFFISALISLVPFLRESQIIGTSFDLYCSLTLLIIALFVVYRHRSNITRIMSKTERKITWMK